MKKARYLFYLILIVSFSDTIHAQDFSAEFWPETDIWYRINPHWRASVFAPITKYNESKSRDWNVYAQLDYAWGKSGFPLMARMADDNKVRKVMPWLVRGGYMLGRSFKAENGYRENMVYGELHRRVPLKHQYLLTHRLRAEQRWLGENQNQSARIRYRLMLEKNFSFNQLAIVPYVNLEPYFDSRYGKISRIRAIVGNGVTFNDHWSVEGNLTYQYDDYYDTKHLLALNIILHIYLEHSKH